MRKIGIVVIVTTAAFLIAGCGNVNITIKSDKGSSAASQCEDEASDLTDLSAEGDTLTWSRKDVTGPYGKLSINVPDDWYCKVCPIDNDEMSYGYYGFTIHPEDVKEGIIAIFCANRFGVCGTELKQEETVIAGKPARIGTYDNHQRWDFIVIGDEDPQIVATGGACDSWTDDEWQTVRDIIDTIAFDPSVTAGCIWQYTPESEDIDIGVSMDLSHITPAGAIIHFYRFDTGDALELSYGEGYILEKENAGKWEEVPQVGENAGFIDIAYIIPENETCEIKTNWEWLYGALSPGTYRIKKTVTEGGEGKYKNHELAAQFMIADR